MRIGMHTRVQLPFCPQARASHSSEADANVRPQPAPFHPPPPSAHTRETPAAARPSPPCSVPAPLSALAPAPALAADADGVWSQYSRCVSRSGVITRYGPTLFDRIQNRNEPWPEMKLCFRTEAVGGSLPLKLKCIGSGRATSPISIGSEDRLRSEMLQRTQAVLWLKANCHFKRFAVIILRVIRTRRALDRGVC